VYPESVAQVTRTVRFGADNLCKELFELRYGTKDDGAISIAHHPQTNKFNPLMTTKEQKAAGDRKRAVEVVFHFEPDPQDPGQLDLRIHKGFDRGSRNTHFHLTDPHGCTRRYRHMTYELDLTGYQQHEFRLGPHPGLWLEPDADYDCRLRSESVLEDQDFQSTLLNYTRMLGDMAGVEDDLTGIEDA
jgi:hypothetical protein